MSFKLKGFDKFFYCRKVCNLLEYVTLLDNESGSLLELKLSSKFSVVFNKELLVCYTLLVKELSSNLTLGASLCSKEKELCISINYYCGLFFLAAASTMCVVNSSL